MVGICVFLAALLGADAKVSAPDSAAVGEFVLIDASESVGELTWTVPDKDVSLFLTGDKRQAILYSPKAKRCVYIVVAKDAAGTASRRDVIDFTGTEPQPAPSPMPPAPKPKPDVPTPPTPDKPQVLPEGKFKVAQGSHDHAMKVEAKKERKRAEAEMLAVKLEGIKKRIESGEIDVSKPRVLMAEIQSANGQLPQDVQSRWSVWGTWWGKFLFGIWSGGALKTAADWILIFEETILGLRAVT